jgi:hypothetical protein
MPGLHSPHFHFFGTGGNLRLAKGLSLSSPQVARWHLAISIEDLLKRKRKPVVLQPSL